MGESSEDERVQLEYFEYKKVETQELLAERDAIIQESLKHNEEE